MGALPQRWIDRMTTCPSGESPRRRDGAEQVNERETGKINQLLELYASLTPIILRMRTMQVFFSCVSRLFLFACLVGGHGMH